MKYTIKWIEDNLGISRKTIMDYMKDDNPFKKEEEKKKYNYLEDKRRNNELIEFTEEEIKKIWYIKTFIGMGYTHKDIKKMIETFEKGEDYDFSISITKKIKQLEEDIILKIQVLKLAKTIKMTGRVPILKEIGAMNYQNFMDLAKEKWNFAINDDESNVIKKAIETIKNYNDKEVDKEIEIFKSDVYQFEMDCESYYRIIKEMKDLDYKSELVQSVVRKFYVFFCNNSQKFEFDFDITPKDFALHLDPYYFDGDLKKINEAKYGKEGCIFISVALWYFAKTMKDKAMCNEEKR